MRYHFFAGSLDFAKDMRELEPYPFSEKSSWRVDELR